MTNEVDICMYVCIYSAFISACLMNIILREDIYCMRVFVCVCVYVCVCVCVSYVYIIGFRSTHRD